MSASIPIRVLVEGDLDEAVIRQVCAYVSIPIQLVYGQQGKGYILDRLANYNQAAQFSPWLVVVDLDRDADCAPDFVRDRLPHPANGMCFRVVVRAIEAWLLADIEQLSTFVHVPETRFPSDPDQETDPKITLVNLVRQHGRRRTIQEDIVPREGSGRSVGPGYVGRLIEFVTTAKARWRPEIALQCSDSLRRCVAALHTLKDWKPPE
jgi:hypothetical protein